MAETEVRLTVHHPAGLHARPAAAVAELLATQAPAAEVRTVDNRRASGDSVLEIMLLGIKQGDTIWISSRANLSKETIDALELLVGMPAND